jgi:hypothetical protein
MTKWRNGQMSWTEPFERNKSKWLKNIWKKCSPFLAIKEKQIKTTLRLHLTPVRIATIKSTNDNKCWQRCRKKRNPHILMVGMWASTTTMENSMEVPQKTKNSTAIRSSNITLRDIPERMWLGLLQRHLHTHVYCSTITITKLWKQPRCPTTDEWIKKMWYLYTKEFY